MDIGKGYYDTDGNECSIWQMVMREPHCDPARADSAPARAQDAGSGAPRVSQSRLASAIEAVANVAVGYCVAIATQAVVLPLFGLHATVGQHAAIAGIFTMVSLVRSYLLRRAFNRLSIRHQQRHH